MKRFAVVEDDVDVARVIEEVRAKQFGAIAAFIGTVREVNEGRAVTAIEYSAYKSMAEAELSRILDEAEELFGVCALVVEHRTGFLQLGDVSVAIAAAHEHRAPALDCTRYVIEEIKKRLPIWKLEHYADGARDWIDPTRNAPEPSRA
ncbi:MAG: molybdenum cofactor biosynthesis protein MoaE [Gemmatimonadaceae bacterium]